VIGDEARFGAVPASRSELTVLPDPANERLWEQLMLALRGAGRTAEALAACQKAHTCLTAVANALRRHPGQRIALVVDGHLTRVLITEMLRRYISSGSEE